MTITPRSVADSIVRAIFSPTTEPIEPPMNAYSITAMTTGVESSSASAVMTASLRPVRS